MKIAVDAVGSVYTAKLRGMLWSWLLKVTVTCAPAGTVIELLSNARFWAVSSTEAALPPAVVAAVVSAVVACGATVVGAAVGVCDTPPVTFTITVRTTGGTSGV